MIIYTGGLISAVAHSGSLHDVFSSSPAVQRVFDVEMASQSHRNRLQVAELVHQFQHQPGDTGSTPVQSQYISIECA